jgi:predicted phage terminase large subunit-like protein
LVVRRQGNPKESTVEAHGLIDGMPTGKHFKLRVYDDVVTAASVTSPDMIGKTTEAWELSDNLGTEGGVFRIVGTRYHFNDTYGEMMRRRVVEPRIYPATVDGSEAGDPVLMSRETLANKRRTQGPYTYATQMLLNPRGDESQSFKRQWINYLQARPETHSLNKYLLCDPANEKKKSSDWTAMWVVGLGPDNNYVILDAIRDKLNLAERAEALIYLHRRWKPIATGYEKYGVQADIQHIESVQHHENYRFKITPLGGTTSKSDRIKRLLPLFEQGRLYFPASIHKTLFDGTTVNLIEVFVEQEYLAFPVSVHDDMLDCLARIVDPDFPTKFPGGSSAGGGVVDWNPRQKFAHGSGRLDRWRNRR